MQGNKGRGRGFASMSPEKKREIASKGGKAAHQMGTAHKWTSEEAQAAGRKGGSIAVARRMLLRHKTGSILRSGWLLRQPFLFLRKLYVKGRVYPGIIDHYHEMQVRPCRSSCTSLIANHLPFCHVLPNFDDEAFHMPINRCDIIPVIDFYSPSQP